MRKGVIPVVTALVMLVISNANSFTVTRLFNGIYHVIVTVILLLFIHFVLCFKYNFQGFYVKPED